MSRQLEPYEWGRAFAMLLELRGVKRGKGGDRRSTSKVAVDTIAGVAGPVSVVARRHDRTSAGVGTWIKAVLYGPKRKAESRRLVLNLSAVDLPAPGSCQYPVKQSVAEMAEPVDAPG